MWRVVSSAIVIVLLSSCVCCSLGNPFDTEASAGIHRARFLNQHENDTIELLIVADYSSFKSWYDKTPSTDTHQHRVSTATRNVKQYVGTLIHSSNMAYKSLEKYNIYIHIKLVDMVVITDQHSSPWTEDVKVQTSSQYEVDPNRVLPTFQAYSLGLQRTIPHDQAILFTMYDLYHEHSSGSTFSGYSYTDAECKEKSVALVQDNKDFYTAQLIAHEIGHTLGCEHDGDGNRCPTNQGYTMETSFILANKNKWTFSTCSRDYIQNYIHDLNSHSNTNCMKKKDNHHPSTEMAQFFSQWYGQVYSADEQCRIHYGSESYCCRDQYHADYSNICLKFFCYNPVKKGCYYIDGGDATPCGHGKWCMSNECVPDSNAPAVPDNCPVGEQPGIVQDQMTCAQLVNHDPSQCHHHSIRYRCCMSCNPGNAHVTTSSAHVTHAHVTHAHVTNAPASSANHITIDEQCMNKHGSGSKLCRGAVAYDNLNYSDVVCGDLQCVDTTRSNWCLSTSADDKTTCGNNKWCINSRCVHDVHAPPVSDTCPWGDDPGLLSSGHTCDYYKSPENNWHCYHSYNYKRCCATCDSVNRHTLNCTYGDKSDWCQHNIRSQYDSRTCYYGNNADLCCESCARYANKQHAGCEYGDTRDGCIALDCHTYSTHKRSQCCQTCGSSSASLIG